jgi:hypothetical protein
MVDGRASAEPTNRKNIWKSKSSLKRKRRTKKLEVVFRSMKKVYR